MKRTNWKRMAQQRAHSLRAIKAAFIERVGQVDLEHYDMSAESRDEIMLLLLDAIGPRQRADALRKRMDARLERGMGR